MALSAIQHAVDVGAHRGQAGQPGQRRGDDHAQLHSQLGLQGVDCAANPGVQRDRFVVSGSKTYTRDPSEATCASDEKRWRSMLRHRPIGVAARAVETDQRGVAVGDDT